VTLTSLFPLLSYPLQLLLLLLVAFQAVAMGEALPQLLRLGLHQLLLLLQLRMSAL
jgi:hypothetical protein